MSWFSNNNQNQYSPDDVRRGELFENVAKEYSSSKGYRDLQLDNGTWRATDCSGQSVQLSREYMRDALEFETAWDDFSSRDKGLDSWDDW